MTSAVVTGGGRGIGRATALALAARGYDVALLARTTAEVEAVGREVATQGRRALTLTCDVSSVEDVARAGEEVLRALGAPRLVVNNAGNVLRTPVASMKEEEWDRVVDVNLKGSFLVTRAFLPAMLEMGHGRIVFVGSISSTLGTAQQSAYCAAKWGVLGFAKSLAEELRGTGLQSVVILPGSVDTHMLKGSRFAPAMSAEDVARAIVYAGVDAPDATNGGTIEMFGP